MANDKNAVEHGLNAARENAENSQEQQQVEALSSQLNSSQGAAAASQNTLASATDTTQE